MRFFIYLFSLVFLLGCGSKIEVVTPKLSQDPSFYLQEDSPLNISQENLKKLKEHYLEVWYSPWKNPTPDPRVSEVFWIAPSLLKRPLYGPNFKRYDTEEMKVLYDSMDMEHYPSVALKAIITKDTAVRATPTHSPSFKAIDNYPFDRWQNALIFQGTPVLITHYNLTKDWAHIQSSFVYGWVRVSDLAKVGPEDEKFFYGLKKYALANKDKTPIYDANDAFLGMARVGEIFGVKSEGEKSYEIILVGRKSNGFVELKSVRVKKEDFSLFPRKMDILTIASVIDSMMGQFYGWGGGLQSRDCSAFVRDVFANFGIYLPRNSAAQVRYGDNMVDLSKFSSKEKEEYIIKNATPFATLLWLRGHIMLYLGVHEGRAIVAHSAWSVMTRKMFVTTERILGGVVITTLEPESEKNGVFMKSKTLLDRVQGMSDLYQYVTNLP